MSIETSSTKFYLRELAPLEAIHKIESFRIPSPYKEILIASCEGLSLVDISKIIGGHNDSVQNAG